MENNFCPNCGATLEADAVFCSVCGAPVNGEESASQQPVYQQPVYQQPAPQQPMYQQPMYQQPMYQQPMYRQPVSRRGANGFGIAGMVLGIIAIVLLVIVVSAMLGRYMEYKDSFFYDNESFWYVAESMLSHNDGMAAMTIFSLVFALNSLPMSIVGLCMRNRAKGMATVGLIFSIICTAVVLIFMSL